jgi:outer membrane protein W
VTGPLQQDQNHWRLRFNLAWVNPTGDSVSTSAWHGYHKVHTGTGFGAGLQAEYRASPRLGIELGVLGAAEFDFTSRYSRRDSRTDLGLTGFAPLSVGLNLHLTPERSFDLYAGPLVALVSYSTDHVWVDLPLAGIRLAVDDDWAWGLAAGLDLPLGKRGWLFNANLRYLDTDILESRGEFRVGGSFDPVVFSLGFGYAF